jgi:putative tricarboxylic transport membrane protein
MMAVRRVAPFVALLIGAAYLFWLAVNFEYPQVPGRLGPDAWPKIILGLLIVTCLVGIANALLGGEAASHKEQPGAAPGRTLLPGDLAEPDAETPSRYGLVAMGFALFAAYPFALEYVGFPVATFALMALFMIVGQWRNPLGILLTSLLGTLVLFYIFRGIVYVSLPLGTGPFQDFTVWIAHLMLMR